MSRKSTAGANLKTIIKAIPVVGPAAGKISQMAIFGRLRHVPFTDSASFWETVYRTGGTSGPGSYGRLAEFKAEVLNDFVRNKNIQSVVEFGCGDGNQLQLAVYPQYVGVDVSAAAVERCSNLFAGDGTKRFIQAQSLPENFGPFDLAISLDVIYHLVEDRVFHDYMRRLFDSSNRFVAIYASNYEARTRGPHVRHRRFTTWIAENAPQWQPAGFVRNRYPADPMQPEQTSFADFHFFATKNVVEA
jgi:SAM-dependent methyltransferase